MDFDAGLIEQSIATQYGVLPSAQGDLKYSDWCLMVSGLMEDTPLGRVIGIRCESDPEVISRFTQAQKNVRSDWAEFVAKNRQENVKKDMKQLQAMIAGLFGG